MIIMTLDRLCQQLEKRLRMPLPPATREAVKQSDMLAKVTGVTQTLTEAAEEVRGWLERAGVPVPGSTDRSPTLSTQAERKSPLAASRRIAVSLLLAREASKDEVVQAFRDKVLGGRLIHFEKLDRWIQEHWESDGPPTTWIEVPLSGKWKLEGETVTVTPSMRIGKNFPLEGRLRTYTLKYATPDLDTQIVKPVAKGGILDQLRFASEHCARLYGWQEGQATIFILTGRMPLITRCRTTTRIRSIQATARITLEIDPSLSPKEVGEAYQAARKKIQGRRRELSAKHITLGQFLAESPDGETLAAGMKRWNRKYRKWRYKQVTNFGRDMKAAERRLMNPGL